MLSAGCAVQNMLLLATAMGLGSALTSGKALKSPLLRQALRLQETEHAICLISLGTVSQHSRANHVPILHSWYWSGQRHEHDARNDLGSVAGASCSSTV